jgi:hypothetical protein
MCDLTRVKMKLIFLIVLFLSRAAMAAPFLVCDEYPFMTESGLNVTSFTVGGLPGGTITVPATINPTSQGQYLHYDLANVTLVNGQSYTITAFATNIYGSSGPPATVIFTRGVPAAPANLRISPS